jgi:hypothetical protein
LSFLSEFVINDNNIEIQRSYSTTRKPFGHWKYKPNQKEFFDALAVKWNIKSTEDWNKVTREMVLKEGGSFIKEISLSKGKIRL